MTTQEVVFSVRKVPPPKIAYFRIIRWVLFIPLGFLGGIILSAMFGYFINGASWLIGAATDTPLDGFLAQAVAAYSTVSIGAIVSPIESKTIPATIMATLMIGLYIFCIIGFSIGHDWLKVAECSIGFLVTIVAAIMKAYDQEI